MADIRAEWDFLSRDIRYHTSCHALYWKRYGQRAQKISKMDIQSDEDNVAYISAEIELFAELKERTDQGDIITVTGVAALYNNMLHDHGIYNNNINMQVLL